EGGAPSYALGVVYGAPIREGKSGFRLSAWAHSDGGFIDIQDPYTGQSVKHNANSAKSYVFRPALTLVPTKDLSITPAIFLQRHRADQSDVYWRTLVPQPRRNQLITGFGAKVPQTVDDDLNVFSVAVKYNMSNLTLQSDSSYLYRKYNDF